MDELLENEKDAQAQGARDRLRPISAYFDVAALRSMFAESKDFLMPYVDFIRQRDGAALLARSRLVCACYLCTAQCNRTYQETVWDRHIVGNTKGQRTARGLLHRVDGQPVLHVYAMKQKFFLPSNQTNVIRAYVALSNFAPSLVSLAKTLPSQLGLSEGYYAYHWRSEKVCVQYSKCAKMLLQAKTRVEQTRGVQQARSLLISDIPATNQTLWPGMAGHLDRTLHSTRHAEASFALQMLLGQQMVKLDSLPAMAGADPGAISILDLLLGKQAGYLVTCTSRHFTCAKTCAWAGNFAQHLHWLRGKRNTSTSWDN
jgi:hypothetical protein|uniref:Uncharacterized protein n=1 Tax=Haptolina ericina TaxID=156174 RepID=A0A7S3ANE8_9EUKA|mmetsp:Transcript_23865/g.54326  ORF Transcript_23865/g.54326 Transcript_23865/m.54326 type:complete len:315 (+) Transcript_23865:354-1298(+)